MIDKQFFGSDADLYFAKLQFEERIKYAMHYEFNFESPIIYVRRFFESAFASNEREL